MFNLTVGVLCTIMATLCLSSRDYKWAAFNLLMGVANLTLAMR